MGVLIVVLNVVVIAGVTAIAYLQKTLNGYAVEKGKNLATREDVEQITRQVESVKADYAKQLLALEHAQKLLLEQSNQRHQLSMAVIERRLQAHQDAFSRSLQLSRLAHDKSEGVTDRLNGMLQWYSENCLYLAPEAGRAFVRACHAAHMHSSLVEGGPTSSTLVRDNWEVITLAPETIAAAVQLPGIGAELVKELAPPATSSPGPK
jgi:hypothetical protein